MQITAVHIKNFKSIRDMKIEGIENALILVGKNNTGKTAVLDAVRAALGEYEIQKSDFRENYPNVEISMSVQITEVDLQDLHAKGAVSQYRRYDTWRIDFEKKLPSYENGQLYFNVIANKDGKIRYYDGHMKHILIFRGFCPSSITLIFSGI